MEAEKPGRMDYPFSGPMFVLTHRPPEPPDPKVTILSGDVGEAVATALDAAGGKNLEILGADVAGQCLRRGLVDEILVYVLPLLLGGGIRFSSPGLPRIDLEPVSSTRSGAVTILRFRHRLVGREQNRDVALGELRSQLFARLTEELAVDHGNDRKDRRRELTEVGGVLDGGLRISVPLDDDALGSVLVEVGVVLQRAGVLGPHDLHRLGGQAQVLVELAFVELESSDTHELTHVSAS
jgi:dihydrofolate reductase